MRTSTARTAGRLVAALRRGRALHPRGMLLAGTIQIENPVLGERGEHEVLARLSKGLSVPGRLPDVLGLAVRLPDGVDLLLSTGLFGRVPFPRRSFTSGPYSSLTSYRCGARVRPLVARPEGPWAPADPALLPRALPLVFHLWTGTRYLARLLLREALPGRDLTFDPVLNSRPDLHPVGRLQRLRRDVYAGSREGRDAALTGHPTPAEPGRPS
uniref:hypothetical protein n=1 Tax=Nonomuraea pusilla TaxID=46177 RepID=UPI0006E25910|nr:hypothetical protein [Nonomuraea pusilla]